MPFVNVQTIKGIMNPEQKEELLRRMTDLIVEIEGKGDPEFRRSVWVRIDEHEPEQWLKRSQQNFRLLNNPARSGAWHRRWRPNVHVYP